MNNIQKPVKPFKLHQTRVTTFFSKSTALSPIPKPLPARSQKESSGVSPKSHSIIEMRRQTSESVRLPKTPPRPVKSAEKSPQRCSCGDIHPPGSTGLTPPRKTVAKRPFSPSLHDQENFGTPTFRSPKKSLARSGQKVSKEASPLKYKRTISTSEWPKRSKVVALARSPRKALENQRVNVRPNKSPNPYEMVQKEKRLYYDEVPSNPKRVCELIMDRCKCQPCREVRHEKREDAKVKKLAAEAKAAKKQQLNPLIYQPPPYYPKTEESDELPDIPSLKPQKSAAPASPPKRKVPSEGKSAVFSPVGLSNASLQSRESGFTSPPTVSSPPPGMSDPVNSLPKDHSLHVGDASVGELSLNAENQSPVHPWKKRLRAEHHVILRQEFVKDPYPSKARMAQLAKEFGVSVDCVSVYVTNRRQGVRRRMRRLGFDTVDKETLKSFVADEEQGATWTKGQPWNKLLFNCDVDRLDVDFEDVGGEANGGKYLSVLCDIGLSALKDFGM